MDKQFLAGRVATVQKALFECEPDYLEIGMRVRIVSIDDSDPECPRAVLRVDEFEEFNRPLETANYYDKNDVPCLTARESGHYADEQTVYLGSLHEIDEWLKLEDGPGVALMEEFAERKRDGETYYGWLERTIIEERASRAA